MMRLREVGIPDAIIVLANQMDAIGVLNSESKARANRAVEIFHSNKVSTIVTCGWAYRTDSDLEIANAFKRYIVDELGVDPIKVVCELNSRDTVGDAYFTKVNLAIPMEWKCISVVTSAYHVERTREIFDFVYGPDYSINVVGATVSHDESTLAHEKLSVKAFRETFSGVNAGDHIQMLKRLRLLHPFYNGQVYGVI